MRYKPVSDNMRNGRSYNGNTPKFGITIGDEDYIVKIPKSSDPYDTAVFSEYICSSLIRDCCNVYCQEVSLGKYHGQTADVIKDFTSNSRFELHSFRDTRQSSEDTDVSDKEYTYEDVLYLIDRHLKMTDREKNKVKTQFWNMFICDAVCANRDRHWGISVLKALM